MEKPKIKTKSAAKICLGLSAAAALGFAQGSWVEKIFIDQIIEAFKDGDLTKIAAYTLIFFLIWLEVRGIKNEMKIINVTVAKSFAEGEKRFEAIELDQKNLRDEFSAFKKTTQGGALHERTSIV